MDETMNAIRKQLGYMLSLPERTVRSLAAVAGGTTNFLAETLFPDAVRDSSLYKVLIGDMQRFVTQQIARMPADEKATSVGPAAGSPDYVQRKVVGGALETAGLFAMHLSPLWVFALAGDAAAGSNVFLNRLVAQLKENGVIPKDTQVDGVTDLLGAIQDASRRSASAVDTPPLSREELSKLAGDMTDSYKKIFGKARDLLPRIDDLWKRLTETASRENISLERLSGMLAVDVAEVGRRGLGAAMAVGQTGADLFGDKILTSYARTLDDMTKRGVSDYISDKMKPFLDTAIAHFDPNRTTWIESKLGLGPEESTGKTQSAESGEPFPPPPPGCGSSEPAHPFPPHPPKDGPSGPVAGGI
jgi:hypothetical protein